MRRDAWSWQGTRQCCWVPSPESVALPHERRAPSCVRWLRPSPHRRQLGRCEAPQSPLHDPRDRSAWPRPRRGRFRACPQDGRAAVVIRSRRHVPGGLAAQDTEVPLLRRDRPSSAFKRSQLSPACLIKGLLFSLLDEKTSTPVGTRAEAPFLSFQAPDRRLDCGLATAARHRLTLRHALDDLGELPVADSTPGLLRPGVSPTLPTPEVKASRGRYEDVLTGIVDACWTILTRR